MRILESELLPGCIVLILLLLFICLANLVIFVRYRRNLFAVCLHITSLFALVSIFSLIIDLAVLNLAFERVYRTIATVSGILFLISIVISSIVLIINRDKGLTLFGFSSDCKSIISEAHDIALIADYNGLIIDVNHPDILNEICPRANTLNVAFQLLKANASPPIPEYPNEINQSRRYEVYLPQRGIYYLISVLPMLSGGMRVGYTVLLQDVSAIKQSESQLIEQNAALEDANRRLSHYVTVTSALEAEKKRLQIFEHLQKTLIDRIKDVITRLGQIQNKIKLEEPYREDIRTAASILRGIYADVRVSVSQIAGKDTR